MSAAERLPYATHTRRPAVSHTTLPGDVAPLPVADDAPGVDVAEAVRLSMLDAPDVADLHIVEEYEDDLPRPADPRAAALQDARALQVTAAELVWAIERDDRGGALDLVGDAARHVTELAAYVAPAIT